MIERKGECIQVSGRITMADAAVALDEGRQFITGDAAVFDLAAVSEADSSALAVLFGWIREAQGRGVALSFANTPASLVSLADVYGVSDLLPQR